MTTDQKKARRKLSLLALAADLGNVSKACKAMGYPCQQFYAIRRKLQAYGVDGLLDRLHRTLLDEHFSVEGRKTWFETIEEMQVMLDAYLASYNTKRPRQGRGVNGRTPAKAFRDRIPKVSQQEGGQDRPENRRLIRQPETADRLSDYHLCKSLIPAAIEVLSSRLCYITRVVLPWVRHVKEELASSGVWREPEGDRNRRGSYN